MSAGARVDPEDNWLVGEDKELIFTVYDEQDLLVNPDGWACRYQLFPARAVAGTAPLLTVDVVGFGGLVTVPIPGTVTALLRGGTYEHVLRRTDAGAAAVLAYDSVALGEAP